MLLKNTGIPPSKAHLDEVGRALAKVHSLARRFTEGSARLQAQPKVQEKHRAVPGSRRLQTRCTFVPMDFIKQPEKGMLTFMV